MSEKGGLSLLSGMQNNDPFREKKCWWREQCSVDVENDCMQTGCNYKITCNTCSVNNLIDAGEYR